MNDISYIGIAWLCLLVIPTLFINRKLHIKLNKEIVISILRMIVQLSIVGLYLQYIFELNNPILNIAYLFIMMFIANMTILKNTGLKRNQLILPLFISIVIPTISMVLFFNTFVINLDAILDARYIITISGMLLGNILNGCIVGLTTYYKGIGSNKEKVNYDLALGATLFQATKPYFTSAIQVAIRPTVASMATIGLVALPGMMTGQILGGSVPLEAIMYQIAIMIAIYVTRYACILLSLTILQNMLFDKRQQLIS